MRTKVGIVAVGFSFMLLAISLTAHHSYTEYDKSKQVKVTGVVSKVEWQNPHVRIYVDSKDASGNVTTWNFEMASTVALRRGGWSKTTLPVGTVVTISGMGTRDVTTRATASSIVTADGKSLFVGKLGD